LCRGRGASPQTAESPSRPSLNAANKLLALLQEAGYLVEEFEVEIKAIPKLTISVKAAAAASDSKLDAIIKANKENDVIVMVLTALGQANKLREKINLNTRREIANASARGGSFALSYPLSPPIRQ
jgi:hypothetical protein